MRLFLLEAVVSQRAGGSWRQDVQEDVHLETQLIFKYQSENYCSALLALIKTEDKSLDSIQLYFPHYFIPTAAAVCVCAGWNIAATHRHRHCDGSCKAPDQSVVHRQPTEVRVPVAFRVQSHCQTWKPSQPHSCWALGHYRFSQVAISGAVRRSKAFPTAVYLIFFPGSISVFIFILHEKQWVHLLYNHVSLQKTNMFKYNWLPKDKSTDERRALLFGSHGTKITSLPGNNKKAQWKEFLLN